MLFTTANNSAVRSSALVVVNSVDFNKVSRSIVVACSDGNRRVCRIDRCETIQLARDLYRKVRDLIDQRAIFHAAGGNDPSRWFFDVEGFDDDDTFDFIYGMKVAEFDYNTELAEEGAMSEFLASEAHLADRAAWNAWHDPEKVLANAKDRWAKIANELGAANQKLRESTEALRQEREEREKVSFLQCTMGG